MDLFPRIDLITLPTIENTSVGDLQANPEKRVLIVYDEGLDFIQRVLAAAGYDQPGEQIHFLQAAKDDEDGLDLSGLIHRLEVNKICLFGQDLPKLGLHFSVSPYFPLKLAGRTYMTCPSAATIAADKERGDNKSSRALWGGIKQAFAR
ncbi:hypothetical protein [Lewinella sp. 4G2]|uniref:hypothetical protein n=1 Tax=Lewinella sp. 4G2 TaxID=1803372 RepID=UPI0007B46756|nr:hypothetical protein [Lewinella sp. 4G2]OAV42614.1 hypothetical protein A3850_015315 [Lewinella sp. 4G2]